MHDARFVLEGVIHLAEDIDFGVRAALDVLETLDDGVDRRCGSAALIDEEVVGDCNPKLVIILVVVQGASPTSLQSLENLGIVANVVFLLATIDDLIQIQHRYLHFSVDLVVLYDFHFGSGLLLVQLLLALQNILERVRHQDQLLIILLIVHHLHQSFIVLRRVPVILPSLLCVLAHASASFALSHDATLFASSLQASLIDQLLGCLVALKLRVPALLALLLVQLEQALVIFLLLVALDLSDGVVLELQDGADAVQVLAEGVELLVLAFAVR